MPPTPWRPTRRTAVVSLPIVYCKTRREALGALELPRVHPLLQFCFAVPVANKRDTRSIEEAMNEIQAKKRLRQSEEEGPALPAAQAGL